jgi:hypothetical protein
VYQGKNWGDFLYTTWENPEDASGLDMSQYTPQGLARFYALPQNTDFPSAATLYRYYDHVHFFTTDPAADSDIIAQGKYQQDDNYYSEALPLPQGSMAAPSEQLVTVYRWELSESEDKIYGHVFTIDPNDAPPKAQANEGAKFCALANAPADPFSDADTVAKMVAGDTVSTAPMPGLCNYKLMDEARAQCEEIRHDPLGGEHLLWLIHVEIANFINLSLAFTQQANVHDNLGTDALIPLNGRANYFGAPAYAFSWVPVAPNGGKALLVYVHNFQ